MGVCIVIDYNDSVCFFLFLIVVIMNGVYSIYYLLNFDLSIEYLLYGWNWEGGLIDYDFLVDDVWIWNI